MQPIIYIRCFPAKTHQAREGYNNRAQLKTRQSWQEKRWTPASCPSGTILCGNDLLCAASGRQSSLYRRNGAASSSAWPGSLKSGQCQFGYSHAAMIAQHLCRILLTVIFRYHPQRGGTAVHFVELLIMGKAFNHNSVTFFQICILWKSFHNEGCNCMSPQSTPVRKIHYRN